MARICEKNVSVFEVGSRFWCLRASIFQNMHAQLSRRACTLRFGPFLHLRIFFVRVSRNCLNENSRLSSVRFVRLRKFLRWFKAE